MVAASYPKRFEVYWINLDPTIGAEGKKTRPCVIVSPDSMNQGLQTVIVAPLTSTEKKWPFRIPLIYKRRKSYIMLDQIRVISKLHLRKKDGAISEADQKAMIAQLNAMFVF